MKPSKLTVYELFQQNKRYVIPLYQRPYVWSREEQWEPLWEDIEAKAQAMLSGRNPRPHFLGAVVLNQVKTYMRQLPSSQVIDGQQRLTTLQIFLAAFRDIMVERAGACTEPNQKSRLEQIALELKRLTTHDGLMDNPIERYKVWPTNSDRNTFQEVMTAGSRTTLDEQHPIQYEGRRKPRPLPGPKLVETYRYFDEALRKFLSQTEPTPAAGIGASEHALFDALRFALQLVVIELDEEDDPQVIFETLNARGAPLLPSDLIRNFVFTRAAGQQENTDTLYKDLWESYDINLPNGAEGFWKQELQVGRLKRPRLDLFFQHYLVCKSQRDIVLSHLYEEFRAWWSESRPELSVRAGLSELKRFSEMYAYFHAPEDLHTRDPRLATFLQRMLVLDNSTIYPFLLFILVEAAGGMSRAARDEILTDLESFLVRRRLCGLTSKAYNRIFATLLGDLRSSGRIGPQDVRTSLLALTKESRWPDDRDLERSWLGAHPMYQLLYSAEIQMILVAIHEQMLTAKQEKVQVLGALSVEHVMPQSWRAHWAPPAALKERGVEDETAEERRDRLLNTAGNLTLLTQELNSSISNGPYDAKRTEITQQSLLRLNAYFQKVSHWDEEAILARGRELLAYARQLWPYPTASAGVVGTTAA